MEQIDIFDLAVIDVQEELSNDLKDIIDVQEELSNDLKDELSTKVALDTRELLTLKQAADLLNVTWQTVRNYIKAGDLAAIKLSGDRDYRINPLDLIRFLKDKEVTINDIELKSNNILNNSTDSNIEKLVLLNNKNTKNCMLLYDNKQSEENVLKNIKDVELECIEKQHDLGFLNSIYQGDNIYVLKKLLQEYKNKIDLIYIDPPFGTNQDFIAYDGKTGYSDKLTNAEFLEFLRQRLILLRELLSPKGSIYLHIDKKMGHYVKIIMDEIFGEKNFINEITRIKCNPKNFARKAYGNYSDTILFYAKEKDNNIFNDITVPLENHEIEELFAKIDEKGRRYTTHPLHAPGITKDGPTGGMWNGLYPPEGRHWRYHPDVLTELLENNLIEWSETGNPRKIVFAKDHKGKKAQDIWEFKDKGKKYTTNPTEKNGDMLEMIIKNSSDEGSIVLDCFAGSFATLLQAAKLKRSYIGIDFMEDALKIGKTNFSKNKIKYNHYKIKE